MTSQRLFLSALLALAAVGCSSPTPSAPAPAPTASTETKKYLLERVDDAAVVQLYADGFASLPLKEKTLIWHLTQSAIAGRDIFYDQRYRHNLEMREVLEAIVANPNGVDASSLKEIQRYTKLFWINTGPVQQPDRAEVRPGGSRRRRLPPRRRRPRRPARRSRSPMARRSTSFSRA